MKSFLRSLFAAAVATVILTGSETVAGYPRPSSASAAFFSSAFITYLPVVAGAVVLFSALSPPRGIDLWFPLLVGALRLKEVVGNAITGGEWWMVLSVLLALVSILFVGTVTESATRSPPILFGLTVGIALPILAARATSQVLGTTNAVAFGILGGLLTFVLLRALVARWRRVMPVFLLGPAVSLGLWNWQGSSPQSLSPMPATPSSVRRPDIVLVVLDTVRAQALASYGHVRNTMPNLEAFGRQSVRFTHAWTDASWTLPAHASLFSGLRLTRHFYDSGFGNAQRLSPDHFLAARLQRTGYATAAVAANMGSFGKGQPLLSGFEQIEAEPLRPFSLRPWFFDLVAWSPRNPWLKPHAAKFPGPSMRAPWVVGRALSFWSRPDERPRFLFVNLMEAHLPWIPDPEDLGTFGPPGLDVEGEQVSALGRYLTGGRPTREETEGLRARYDESLHSLDRSLGRLLDGVTEGPGNERTVVVVTSDHGESLGEHDRFGHRNSLDEEATRIPLFIHDPTRSLGIDPGQERVTPVQLTDVFGYLARLAGLPSEPDLDSRPFGERRYVVIEHRPGPQGNLPGSYPRGDLSALIDWPFKYVESSTLTPRLFDLSVDPGEELNLVDREPARAEALRLILRRLSGPGSSGTVQPDRANEERLRALGYVR